MGYKGIFFNSKTVRFLSGDLAEAVRKKNVKTAVVSNHGRKEVAQILEELGISVDFVIGKFCLNRFGKYHKPLPDQMFVALARLGLAGDDVAFLTSAGNDDDRTAAAAAGIDCLYEEAVSGEELIDLLESNPEPEPVVRDFSSFKVPETGLMGAIVGDTVGSTYEHSHTTDCDFALFPPRSHPTDDSLGTLAVARWLMGDRSRESLIKGMSQMVNYYPKAGWSHRFRHWARSLDHKPYEAFTNGSAMRVSACGIVASSLDEALDLAKRSAEISHNHPEGIKGAQAIAAAIFLARAGQSKEDIKKFIEDSFGYDLDVTVAEHRARAVHEYTCPVSVPQAIRCWFENDTFETAVRNAVAIGYDADTIGAICGSLCASTPGMEIPQEWAGRTFKLMKGELRDILYDFERYLDAGQKFEPATN